ncbi:MerR family transcriptional regulator [Arthrobacter cupressi]|uniref:DNA-binding transcriptional regulator, MerR family n=1 Tax=Arthrobacter cupressi TaxID=1045773 RepID=A0A1G8RB94_9MICC|nr:MerR family transcriptional regulator [Arthrobacter cupressi]NYD77804.1 DNA-binding transcriptional MerR regulator [Arthrobacter cupressi]SDJ13650.1 DNA-binding transcriptional regulator, MerR family [Arthrobacter cupressi]
MSFTIAQVAEQTGLSAHTLRYYERDGLLPGEVGRASSGRRAYSERDVGGIIMVARLRATGMPVAEIRRYAQLVRDGDASVPKRLNLLLEHREKVRDQLRQAQAHLAAIETKIELYRGFVEGS